MNEMIKMHKYNIKTDNVCAAQWIGDDLTEIYKVVDGMNIRMTFLGKMRDPLLMINNRSDTVFLKNGEFLVRTQNDTLINMPYYTFVKLFGIIETEEKEC